MHCVTRFLMITALVLGAAFSAQAQTAPIKPGLWQVHMEREVNGQKAPDMSDRPSDLFRAEALNHHHEGRHGGGDVLRISPDWIPAACLRKNVPNTKPLLNSVE